MGHTVREELHTHTHIHIHTHISQNTGDTLLKGVGIGMMGEDSFFTRSLALLYFERASCKNARVMIRV